MKTIAILTLALLPSVLGPSLALAEGEPTPGRKLFDAGQRAYKIGDFKAAIEAFEQSFQVEQKPGLLYSIGQAHRRQYAIDRRAGHVAVAIRHFREYLTAVQTGGKRVEAADALQQLEALAKSLEVDGQLPPLEPEPPATRIVVSSPAEGAWASVDGGEKRALPLVLETTPGKHTLVVSAYGYGEQKRDVEIPEHAVTALDVALEETPATLSLEGPSGARVAIDGKDEATLPLSQPLGIASGEHHVRVTLGGHDSYEQTVDASRAAALKMDVELRATGQRKAAIGLLVGGASAFGVGLVTGGVAIGFLVDASSRKSDIDAGLVVCREGPCAELDDYNASVARATSLGAVSGVFLGLGVVAAGTGLVLYTTDAPAPAKVGPRRAPGAAPTTSPELEVAIAPSGIAVRGTF